MAIPTLEEIQFSSSVAKLLQYHYRLRHPLTPITLQLALTDDCNLNCNFCSVKDRPGCELTDEQVYTVLDHSVFRTLHGVEITGAGEPTLWDGLSDLIFGLKIRGLEAGLITNGVALCKNVEKRALALLKWMRVSMNCLDYLDDIDLSSLPDNLTLGFSYVINDRTTDAIIDRVAQYAARYRARYVRIVPDCLDLSRPMRNDLKLDRLGFYIQTKTMRSLQPVAPCRMGFLKPYLNSDGYFYWCSGTCLGQRHFTDEYRMGQYDQVNEIWGAQHPFKCSFNKCFWVEQNLLLEYFNTEIEHREFI